MKIKVTDLADAIAAMEEARVMIAENTPPVFGWLELCGKLRLSQERFKESLADVSVEVETV